MPHHHTSVRFDGAAKVTSAPATAATATLHTTAAAPETPPPRSFKHDLSAEERLDIYLDVFHGLGKKMSAKIEAALAEVDAGTAKCKEKAQCGCAFCTQCVAQTRKRRLGGPLNPISFAWTTAEVVMSNEGSGVGGA